MNLEKPEEIDSWPDELDRDRLGPALAAMEEVLGYRSDDVDLRITSDFENEVKARLDPEMAEMFVDGVGSNGFQRGFTVPGEDGRTVVIIDARVFTRGWPAPDAIFRREALNVLLERNGERSIGRVTLVERTTDLDPVFVTVSWPVVQEYRVRRALYERCPDADGDPWSSFSSLCAENHDGTTKAAFVRKAAFTYDRRDPTNNRVPFAVAMLGACSKMAVLTALVAAQLEAAGRPTPSLDDPALDGRMLGEPWREVIAELGKVPPADQRIERGELEAAVLRVAACLLEWFRWMGLDVDWERIPMMAPVSYWERHPDGRFGTLVGVAKVFLDPADYDLDSLKRFVKREDDEDPRVFKSELREALRDPSQLPGDELREYVECGDGSGEAFLRRLWHDLYGDEPLDVGVEKEVGTLPSEEARKAWIEGVEALGITGPGQDAAPKRDVALAKAAFLRATSLDPGMADAWLGLHNVNHERDVALDRMLDNIKRLGEEIKASGREFFSYFDAGDYLDGRICNPASLYAAHAARALDAGDTERAMEFLDRCSPTWGLATFLRGRALFMSGDYEAMLPVMHSLENDEVIAGRAMLYIGLALASRALFHEAEKALAAAAKPDVWFSVRVKATYFRGAVLREMGRDHEAEECLEWVYSQNPKFMDVAELIADPSLRVIKTEPLKKTGHETGPSSQDAVALLDELDRFHGLDGVKKQVRLVVAQMEMRKERLERGMPVPELSQHLVFTGPPGTGKTMVARLIARIYAVLGVLPGDGFVEATRADLVARYQGQTAPRTNETVNRALDGVLFIDEAYSLAEDDRDSYGREAVEVLLNRMEDARNRLAVIIAGYPEKMARLLESNQGLRSRFTHTIEFSSYSAAELVLVAEQIAEANGDRWSTEAVELLTATLARVAADDELDSLGNARFVRNLYETASGHRDLRLQEIHSLVGGSLSTEELGLITDLDLAPAIEELCGKAV